MNTAQRVIKWCAVAFAVVLICGIMAMIAGAGTLVSYIFGERSGQTEWTEAVISDRWDFQNLRIDVDVTSVKIESGDYFEVLADEEVISFRRSGDTVIIEEKDRGWFGWWDKMGGEVKIILPKDKIDLAKVTLEFGAGAVEVDGLMTQVLELKQGAGRVELRNTQVTTKTKISGGAGLLVIDGTELANLDLDMGVGKVALTAKVSGRSEIDAGVGKLELNLLGEKSDYGFSIDKGLGTITLDGQEISGGYSGTGKNFINIDGGVGMIEIKIGR